MATLTELRRRFETSPDCKFVSPEIYLQRLTGRQSMVRADEPSANLLGLLDQETGNRILVPVEDFMRRRTASSFAQ
ncbi:hypothetical protein [Planctomicrobium piriforme]|uniref:Uncharacterized protein n=1 Tax=Planctomicrobium piriforme TaxID=1576369 RepID=A0A1I3MRH1_9PLAN|nr:hypothetical protein [Planctomicrobium piriforme]SFI99618.1 hypothetical protein SAMN05421753_11487 [Planctomicrobium piriforme]